MKTRHVAVPLRAPLGALLASLVVGSACAPRAASCPAPQSAMGKPAADASSSGPPNTTSSSSTVATLSGGSITLAEVDKAAASELYEIRQKTLDKLITDRAIEPAAKKAGLAADDYLRREVIARVPEVTPAEARAYYESNKARLPQQLAQKTFEDVKDMVIRGLTNQKREEAVEQVVDELRKRAGVKVLLQPPRLAVEAAGPSRGPDNARVTIVEFSDFQCPYCQRGRSVIDEVLKAYPSDVRVIFRDFPLPFHEHAQAAAEAGLCANEQGKFWAMHDWLFDHQDDLESAALSGGARKVGLDGARFDDCLKSGRHASSVAASVKAGEAVGVHGTPAFFVNGVLLSGAQPFEKFKSEIDRELGK